MIFNKKRSARGVRKWSAEMYDYASKCRVQNLDFTGIPAVYSGLKHQ